MSSNNLSSVGRFSSQMLTYMGTQRTIKQVTGTLVNTFKYLYGPTAFVDAGSLLQSQLGSGVVGNFTPAVYDSTKSYFLARSTSKAHADTMTALTIDIAAVLGVNPQTLLERSYTTNGLDMPTDAYTIFNRLRDPSHQVGIATTVKNKESLQARAIRS